jgi:hypothetical protein
MRKSTSLGLAALLGLSTVLLGFTGAIEAASPPGWSEPVPLENTATYGNEPQAGSIAIGPDGRALAAWANYLVDYGASAVLFSWYVPGSGWTPAVIVVASIGGSADSPSVAAWADGSFILVWAEHGSGTDASVQSWRYQAQTGWGNVEQVNSGLTSIDVSFPVVKTDPFGGAMVLWNNFDGIEYNMTANRYTPSTGWSAASSTLDNRAEASYNPGLAVDGLGNAIAIWRQSDAVTMSLWASRYAVGSGWGAAATLESDGRPVGNSAVAMDEAGNGEVAWTQDNGTLITLYALQFTPGGGWAASPSIANSVANRSAQIPSIAPGPSGTFMLVWIERNATGVQHIWARHFDAGSWGTPSDITPSATRDAYTPWVAFDGAGSALVVFWEFEMPSYYQIAEVAWWTLSGGWGPTQLLDPSATFGSSAVSFALNSAGSAALMLSRPDGITKHLFGQTYSPPDFTAPSIKIDAPLDGASLNETSVVVRGSTEAGASVSVNGLVAQVRTDGSFVLRIPLPAGASTIRVTATDAAGNSGSTSVGVTVADPAATLAAANQTIASLLVNQSAILQDLADKNTLILVLQTNISVTQNNLEQMRLNQTLVQQQVNEVHNKAAAADANASASYTLAWNTQQDMGRTQSELNETQVKLGQAQSAASSAMLIGIVGVLAGLVGVAMGVLSLRRGAGTVGAPKKSFAQRTRGGGDAGDREMSTERQTPKADFGDRMKAGLAGEDGGAESARGPRQTTSLDGDYQSKGARESGSGQATGMRVAPADVDGDGKADFARESGSGQSTGKWSSDMTPGSHHDVPARDAATGQASGKVSSPRDSASGQSTGKQAGSAPDSGGSSPSGIAIDESGTPRPKGKKPGA